MAPLVVPNEGAGVIIPPPNTMASTKLVHEATNGAMESSVLHRSLHNKPLKVVDAHDNYLVLDGGREILDATGGAAVACLGHGNERVNRAIAEQMSLFSYCHSLLFSSDCAEELAKILCDSTQGQMSKAFILSSGSEAMEAAMKLARQYFLEVENKQTERVNFIARRESYHGNTLGALSMSGHVARRKLFEPMLMGNISRVSAYNAYRGMHTDETEEQYAERLAQELDDEFQRVGPDTVCAFVAEPVSGAALGCVPATPGYFKAIRDVCDKYGALLIFDEVMSGMGRIGTLHAWEQLGIVPDIQTIGKGLGGGYVPVAGLLINHRIINALDCGTGAFSHGQTYQGHPLACTAALKVQEIIQKDCLLANVRKMGKLLESLLVERLSNHPYVGNIRGKGLFWGIEFVRDKKTKEPFDPRAAVAMGIQETGLRPEFGITLYPGTGTVDGQRGDHILLAPAYNVSEAVIRNIVDLTVGAIHEFFEQMSDISSS